MSTSAKVEEFRNVFEQSLTDIAERTGGVSASDESVRERCIILSGGVDVSSIVDVFRVCHP